MKLIFLSVLLILASCSTTQQKPSMSPSVFYQRDMVLTVNGQTAQGTMVLPRADKYDFMVQAAGPLSMFTMASCSKEESKQDAGNVTQTVRSGLFGWGTRQITVKNKVSFTYYQTELEKDGDCPLELTGLDSKAGQNSWAFIDFESDTYKLPAHIECNGTAYESNGTTVCQSRTGLVQKISFDAPVRAAKNNPCGFPSDSEQTKFEYNITAGRCVTIFGSADKKFHKLTTLGYDGILQRSSE